ncbi:MAG: hybrid sensor histidine kinase/response regulator [Candidatus Eremiobacterota bacterium]
MNNNKEKQEIPLVLIVDDVPKNIQLLGNILNNEGYDIIIAENGKEALERISDVLPDIILLDIMMPEMDGYETCKRLKENDRTRDIPVIFLTAKTEMEDIVKGFNAGSVDYVTKPFNSTELMARVKTHITLKKLFDKEKEYVKELKELNKLKNKLLGIAAHDIRSPIATMQMNIEFLLNILMENLTEEQIDILQDTQYLVNYMNRLLSDILDITVIEAGKLTLDMQKQDYMDFLTYNIKMNRILSDKKNIKINFIYENNLPEILFDRDKMTQVMNNLISNAVKFSNRNTTITIEVKMKDNYILTEVIDQGQGIPAAELSKLFREFQRVSVKPTGNETSTGLGLAITKKIVEGHNGIIGVESEKGKGSRFYFTLPVN